MRPGFRLGTGVLSTAVALAALAAPAAARAACTSAGDTLARTAVARIYFGGPNGDEIFGCLRPSGPSYLLDSETEGRNLVRLAGDYALVDAFDDSARDPAFADSRIVLTNLRTRRQRSIRLPGGELYATDLVLTTGGSFAEIRLVRTDPASPLILEVRRYDRRGRQVLARGNDIVPNSLSLRGRGLRYTQGGRGVWASLR